MTTFQSVPRQKRQAILEEVLLQYAEQTGLRKLRHSGTDSDGGAENFGGKGTFYGFLL